MAGDRISTILATDSKYLIIENLESGTPSIKTMKGEHEFVFIDGLGTIEQFDALSSLVKGKFAICNRGGDIKYIEKAQNAVNVGAKAIIIINNNTDNEGMSFYNESFDILVVKVFKPFIKRILDLSSLQDGYGFKVYTRKIRIK